MDFGSRVILNHASQGRDYATVAGEGSRPETIMLNVDGRFYNPQEHWRKDIEPAIAARDMVVGDLLNLEMLKAVFEIEFIGTLWVEGDSGPMTPYVCDCSFGDGLKLIRIATINQRPNYHVVRVDSGWTESNWSSKEHIGEHIDDILTAIEEECGSARPYCEECENNHCDCNGEYDAGKAFPALDDEAGCSWSDVDWTWLMRKIGLPQ